MNRYKFALFDLDGTLTDPGEGITKSVQYALAKFGIVVEDRTQLFCFIGPPLHESFEKYYGFSTADAFRCVEAYREYYAVKGIYENAVYEGIAECLAALKERGIKISLATSKPEGYAKQILEHFGLDGYFDAVAGSNMDGTRTKKAEVVERALQLLGEPDERACVMIGDREHDVLGGAAHGMDTVGVTFGYGSEDELLRAGATCIAHTPADIVEIFDRREPMEHTVLQMAEPQSVRHGGALADRLERQIARLESDMYMPPLIFESQSIDTWPGDWEGRAMLSQTLTAMATGREPAALDAAMAELAKRLNGNGFLGRRLPHPEADEQQLSGHGWLLRALCAYYEYRRLGVTLFLIEGIVMNLFLPLRETYREYPTDPALRTGGDMSGHVFSTSGKWHLSTDTGCAYIPLDGLTHAYCIYPDCPMKRELGEMIAEMIEKFLSLDPVAMKLQTHATLTATRGILRMYFKEGNAHYLAAAKRIFDAYLAHGMTVNYENQNWFGRPEWTEPCAVIDSFMVASQLYAATGDEKYLPVINRILYNGMLRTQRANGGFGCDTCATDGFLRTHCYEAWWCCTMRGGEGLSACARYAYMIEGNTVIVPYMTDSEADLYVNGNKVHVSSRTESPYACRATYTLTGRTEGVELAVYVPGKGLCRFTPDAEGKVTVDAELHIMKEKAAVGKGSVLMLGDLMLGKADDPTPYKNRVMRDGYADLIPLCDGYLLDEQTACGSALRVVFEG